MTDKTAIVMSKKIFTRKKQFYRNYNYLAQPGTRKSNQTCYCANQPDKVLYFFQNQFDL